MNNKLRFMLIGAVMPAMLCNIGFAKNIDSVEIDDKSNKIIISGTPDAAKKGDFITFELLKKDMQSSEIKDAYTPDELINSFIAVKQVKAGENGGYKINADMQGRESGFYVARINGVDEEIYFASKASRNIILNNITEACKLEELKAAEELAKIFDLSNERSETVNSFYITDKRIFEADEDELFKALRSIIGDKNEETLSTSNINEKLIAAATLCALNEDKATVDDAKDILKFDGTSYKTYNEKLTDSAKQDFVKNYFKGKRLYTRTEANDGFKSYVIDAVCANIKNWADAEDIIKEYGSIIGINTTVLYAASYGDINRSKVYNAAASVGKFESADAFASFVNAKIAEYSSGSADSRPSGGGGGRGGYGGGASGGTTSVPPVVTNETKEDDNKLTTAPSFDDLVGYEWAADCIEELYRKGVVKGMGDGTFNPGGNVTREEMLAMLLRAFGIAESKADGQIFKDANADEWYIGYLATAKEKGYVAGYPDGSFGIGDNVSRQDAAVMAYNISNAAGREFETTATSDFADNDKIADYAKEAVYALRKEKVISGTDNGNFEPLNSCTRAEAAKIIYNLMQG